MKRDKIFYEYFASICIKDNMGNEFKKISHSDAPDLKVQRKYGIEVTQLGTEEEFVFLDRYEKSREETHVSDFKFDKCENYEIKDSIIIKNSDTDEENVLNTIYGKIEKLNKGNYKGFSEYGIFMFLSESIDTFSVNDIINIFKSCKNNPIFYKHIFICCGTDFFYYNIANEKLSVFDITFKIKKYRNYAFNKRRDYRRKKRKI